jgi:hypothetical protein
VTAVLFYIVKMDSLLQGNDRQMQYQLSKWILVYTVITKYGKFVILREVAESAFVVLRGRPCNCVQGDIFFHGHCDCAQGD